MNLHETTHNYAISNLMELSRAYAQEDPNAANSLGDRLIKELAHFFMALMPEASMVEALSLAGVCAFRISVEQLENQQSQTDIKGA